MRAADAVKYLRRLAPDEPVFPLRAQDVSADKFVDSWADLAAAFGCTDRTISEARECAEAMRNWPQRKRPD
jgi:hypothetical protein